LGHPPRRRHRRLPGYPVVTPLSSVSTFREDQFNIDIEIGLDNRLSGKVFYSAAQLANDWQLGGIVTFEPYGLAQRFGPVAHALLQHVRLRADLHQRGLRSMQL
jgi:hypothetical protein